MHWADDMIFNRQHLISTRSLSLSLPLSLFQTHTHIFLSLFIPFSLSLSLCLPFLLISRISFICLVTCKMQIIK